MSIVLYKAPNCLRCNIVKSYCDDNGIAYEAYQLDTDKDTVNAFYRTQRARLYRNAEGAEFPMFHDTDHDEVRQGTGLVLAWLLAGHALDAAVTRSELLHGWISGLDVSRVPDAQEDNFLTLLRLLAQGGLEVCLRSDGRRADLLEKILAEKLAAKMCLDIPGPASVYPEAVGGPAPSPEELKKSIELTRACPNHVIRLLLRPLRTETGGWRWLSPAEAGEAAKMVAEASGAITMPFGIQLSPETAEGLEPLGDNLLPYRAKARNFLPKTEILKAVL